MTRASRLESVEISQAAIPCNVLGALTGLSTAVYGLDPEVTMLKQAWVLTLTALVLSSCVDVNDVEDVELEEADEYEFRNAPLLHPSGVCRIEGSTGWTYKKVKYYHVSDPGTIWFDDKCDPWVGTSECCEEENPFGLTYDECKQLRHEPDCPNYGGGGGDGPGTQQQ